jgi:putative transcriptional regulator
MTSQAELEKNILAEKMAGEIVLSNNPGETIKKWRALLKIPQKDLAKKMAITQSVISDYESGRRKSPGIGFIRKIVETMILIEMEKGSGMIKDLIPGEGSVINAILDIREFTEPITTEKFCSALGCETLVHVENKKEIRGYTVIDSLAAIVNLPPSELVKIYGSSKERALVFTKVTTGKSPMVAIKVTGIRPAMVVMQGSEKIDEVAMKIAQAEGIVLALSKEKSAEDVVGKLKKAFA